MSSGFISEAEIAEQRQLRQEEWKKVRTADQPLDPPEEPFDSRSLYERLQERKNKRDIEYEEAHKFKNMIKGLDDDEVEFLDLVDRTKFEEDRRKNLEEEKEMQDFKAAVSSLHEKTLNNKLMQELQGLQSSAKTSSQSSRNLRLKIISGVVVKKSEKNNIDPQCKDHQVENKRRVTVVDGCNVKVGIKDQPEESPGNNVSLLTLGYHPLKSSKTELDDRSDKNMKCIGILPGLGSYANSSDSDCSSDTDEEPDCKKIKYDILGRKIVHSKDRDRS